MHDLAKLHKLLNAFARTNSTVYSELDEGNIHNPIIDHVVKEIILPLQIPLGASILDIGCGPGRLLQRLAENGYTTLFGITMSKDELTTCTGKGLNVSLMDMHFIEYGDHVFDLVVCRQALEHSPCPLFVLFEIYRILRLGAYCYVEVPVPESRKGLNETNPNHYSVLGNLMWRSLFGKAGFKVVQGAAITTDVETQAGPEKEESLSYILKKV